MFTPIQLERYSRNILVPEIGGKGQEALSAAKVLVIGAGGIGSPLLLYLAASGVGTLGIIDDDIVELSNLQRQIIHNCYSLGKKKTASAQRTLQQLNPEICIITHPERLTPENAQTIFMGYDIIADGSDNIETRFLVNDCCYRLQKPLFSAAIRGFQGQLYRFTPYMTGDYACYRCLYPDTAPVDTCNESGVVGSIAGMMGSLLATEIIKEITGAGNKLAKKILIYDGLKTRFHTARLHRDKKCPVCY